MKSEICIDTHIILFAKPVKFRGQNVLFSTFSDKEQNLKKPKIMIFSGLAYSLTHIHSL